MSLNPAFLLVLLPLLEALASWKPGLSKWLLWSCGTVGLGGLVGFFLWSASACG